MALVNPNIARWNFVFLSRNWSKLQTKYHVGILENAITKLSAIGKISSTHKNSFEVFSSLICTRILPGVNIEF